MIKHKTTRIFNGKRVSRGDVVQGSDKQKEALLECGQAYRDELNPKDYVNESDTKSTIQKFMEANQIEYDLSMTKKELLNEIDKVL